MALTISYLTQKSNHFSDSIREYMKCLSSRPASADADVLKLRFVGIGASTSKKSTKPVLLYCPFTYVPLFATNTVARSARSRASEILNSEENEICRTAEPRKRF